MIKELKAPMIGAIGLGILIWMSGNDSPSAFLVFKIIAIVGGLAFVFFSFQFFGSLFQSKPTSAQSRHIIFNELGMPVETGTESQSVQDSLPDGLFQLEDGSYYGVKVLMMTNEGKYITPYWFQDWNDHMEMQDGVKGYHLYPNLSHPGIDKAIDQALLHHCTPVFALCSMRGQIDQYENGEITAQVIDTISYQDALVKGE